MCVEGEDQIDTARTHYGRGVVTFTWHGRTFVPVARFRGRGYWSMISTSRDGDIQDSIFHRFGFNTVRGSSSNRGAIQSTVRVIKELKRGAVLAHTPDGPRGPNRHFHEGAIFMAQRSGSPVIPCGISAYPRKLLSTWDSYMIPAPFSRGIMLYGAPILIPEGADDDTLKRLSKELGSEIDRLELEAERRINPKFRRHTANPPLGTN